MKNVPIKTLIYRLFISIALFLTAFPGTTSLPIREGVSTIDDQSPEIYESEGTIFLPIIFQNNLMANILSTQRINAPFFDVVNVPDEKFSEMAITWFGKVTSTINYADIRVGYNNEALFVHLEIFDRILWYDQDPVIEDFRNWDSASLYLSLGGIGETTPHSQSYRFDAQLNWWETREAYQAAFRGNGTDWETINFSFETISGWRGNAPNDDIDDRGWGVIYKIPFISLLNQSVPPEIGIIWGMGITLYDRDDNVGTPIEIQSWPENINELNPSTWGQLHFGLPIYTPSSLIPAGSIIIRHKLNGTLVQDAAVGGTTTNLCPGDSYFIWNIWGDLNFAGAPDFNIQNQADVADWPCFSKYYINFPLEGLPVGKEIISATLTLYQFGNAGDFNDPDPRNRPHPSLIQVLSVAGGWEELMLTWNNAPQSLENISQTWVDPLGEFPDWPGVAYEWDVSYSVAQAYSAHQSLNLVLYEADAARHSGKYFSSSDTGDWNENGRPTLVVTWRDP